MPARRELTTRQIRHMLRLAHDGVSAREIGQRLSIARSTYLSRGFRQARIRAIGLAVTFEALRWAQEPDSLPVWDARISNG